jgi:hypothetical protein
VLEVVASLLGLGMAARQRRRLWSREVVNCELHELMSS